MTTLAFVLITAPPYVQLPAGDYTICNQETEECLTVSGGHRVVVEPADEEVVVAPAPVAPVEAEGEPAPAGAPRGIILSAGMTTADTYQGRGSVAFGGDNWFFEPRVMVRNFEADRYDDGWMTTANVDLFANRLTEIDLGFSFGLDSGSRPWFFALAVDLGLVVLASDDDERNPHILHAEADSMVPLVARSDDPGLNAGVLARVGYALGEHLFIAADAHVDVALVEHRATREKVAVGVRTGIGYGI